MPICSICTTNNSKLHVLIWDNPEKCNPVDQYILHLLITSRMSSLESCHCSHVVRRHGIAPDSMSSTLTKPSVDNFTYIFLFPRCLRLLVKLVPQLTYIWEHKSTLARKIRGKSLENYYIYRAVLAPSTQQPTWSTYMLRVAVFLKLSELCFHYKFVVQP